MNGQSEIIENVANLRVSGKLISLAKIAAESSTKSENYKYMCDNIKF